MTDEEYIRLAMRTECEQHRSVARMAHLSFVQTEEYTRSQLEAIRLNHAVLGMTGEVGELAGAIEKWIYYGQPRNDTNILEEVGDILWYLAMCLDAAGFTFEQAKKANIAKLQARYPDTYSDYNATEENRNRQQEESKVQELVDNGHRWAEPPYDEGERATSDDRPDGEE